MFGGNAVFQQTRNVQRQILVPSLPVQDVMLSRLEAAEAGQGVTADLWWVLLRRPAPLVRRQPPPRTLVRAGPEHIQDKCITLPSPFPTLQHSRRPVRAPAAAGAAGSAVPAGARR